MSTKIDSLSTAEYYYDWASAKIDEVRAMLNGMEFARALFPRTSADKWQRLRREHKRLGLAMDRLIDQIQQRIRELA